MHSVNTGNTYNKSHQRDVKFPRFNGHLLITQEVANAQIHTTKKDVALYEGLQGQSG
jgi:hypothetical protein